MADFEKINFTQEEIDFAKGLSLSGIASYLGFNVIKKGHVFCLQEMDSLVIFNDLTWKRFSNKGNITGGTTIDFVMEYGNLQRNSFESEFVAALRFLLDYGSYKSFSHDEIKSINKKHSEEIKIRDSENKEMILPEKNPTGYKRAYAYLIQKRKLSANVVNYFVRNKLMYEEKEHHNIVFLGYDSERKIRFATKRGTMDINGQKYRGDVEGNDKRYGINIVNKNSDVVNVFEASIDMMSYCDLYNDLDKTNKIALSMVADLPLETFLKENPNIKNINLYLDNDEAGRKNALIIQKKYQELGYHVKDNVVPYGKDMNEYLQIYRDKNFQEIRNDIKL